MMMMWYFPCDWVVLVFVNQVIHGVKMRRRRERAHAFFRDVWFQTDDVFCLFLWFCSSAIFF